VLAQTFLGVKESPVAFDVFLHTASLVAILIFFRREILSVFTIRRYLIPILIVGTIPAGVAGVLLKARIEAMFESPLTVAVGLIITGVVLRLGEYFSKDERTLDEITYGDALWVGVAQAIALVPGISRSGMTVSSSLARGLERGAAVAFAFLLGAIAITGATVLKAKEMMKLGTEGGWGPMAAGFAGSLVASLAALVLLSDFARRKRLSWFALYCFVVGGSVLLAKLLGRW
jgi:undecaprenyl-diphosphatase